MAAILDSLGFTFLIDRMTEVLTPDIYIELTAFLPLKWCTITSVRKYYSRNVTLNYNYVRVIAPLK